MDNRPIGVFDSGFGGLTVTKGLMSLLPKESIIYFGDTARVPYGTRSKNTIIKYGQQDVNFLISQNVKMIVVACGTVSSVALAHLQKTHDIPIIGVVSSTAKAAATATRNKKVGVIGTKGTINSGSFEDELLRLDGKIETVSRACPLFVPLVENRFATNQAAYLIAEQYLEPLKQRGVDTIILGCTHFPLLKGVISAIMGADTKLIDGAAPTAAKVADVLAKSNALSDQDAVYKFYVSDSADEFTDFAELFLNREIPNADVMQVDIERY